MGGCEPTPAQARASLTAAIARHPPHLELRHNISLISTTIPYGTEQHHDHRSKPKIKFDTNKVVYIRIASRLHQDIHPSWGQMPEKVTRLHGRDIELD